MSSIWDDADLQPNGEFVKFDAVGDNVGGIINLIRKHTFDDSSTAAQLLLTTDDGDERTVTCGQIMLKNELARLRPEAGDHIYIEMSAIEKRQGGKTMKHFKVEVTPKSQVTPKAPY